VGCLLLSDDVDETFVIPATS